MDRGQAEALFPLVVEAMAEAGVALDKLSAIGVATGPGSFTGVRLGVAAARGLALSLDIPAIGISAFDISAFGISEPVLTVVNARKGCVFARRFPDGPVIHAAFGDLTGKVDEPLPVVGYRSEEIAEVLETRPLTSRARAGEATALLAGQLLPWHGSRPEPEYLRPAVPAMGDRVRPDPATG